MAESRRDDPGSDARLLGAAKGLEALIRLAPQRPVRVETRERLRQLVTRGPLALQPAARDVDAQIRRVSLLALAAARDDDAMTMGRAAADGDWQMRRIVATRLNLADPDQARLGERLAADEAFQVRYEMVGAASRLAARTKLCAPVAKFFDDQEPLVVMRALDAMSLSCTDLDESLGRIVEWASVLARPDSIGRWHVPSRALTTLARVKPDAARGRVATATVHSNWQVRAAAASSCAVLGMEAETIALASDAEPNVRTAAIEALSRLKSPAVVAASISALNGASDHQLLRAAAQALKGVPEAARDGATEALLAAMRRLTDKGDDTSRDPRVAMLERLGEVMRPERSAELIPFTADVDDEVNAAAAKAFQALVGAPPAGQKPRRRYPYQPGEAAIATLPRTAELQVEQGVVTIALLGDVAPVTIARVAELTARGYYNDLTFHRIVANFVVQGGSPGANEYVGASRYMRDEAGPQASHLRGAVGISTRGRDTGDAQIFIDLVDVPRLDRDYTVFGYVTSGMEIVDRLLEGAVIKSLTVR